MTDTDKEDFDKEIRSELAEVAVGGGKIETGSGMKCPYCEELVPLNVEQDSYREHFKQEHSKFWSVIRSLKDEFE